MYQSKVKRTIAWFVRASKKLTSIFCLFSTDAARKTNLSKSLENKGHDSKFSSKNQSSLTTKNAGTSNVSSKTKGIIKIAKFKGRNKSSETRKRISKSDLEKLKRKLESTLQLKIKIVRGNNKENKTSNGNWGRKTDKFIKKVGINKLHLKGNKNSTTKKSSKEMRKIKNPVAGDKHYIQQQNQMTNSSKEDQKVSAPVPEADHHRLSSSKTSSQISEFKKQHPSGKTHDKKTLPIVPKVKFETQNKTLKPVLITNILTSVKNDKNRTKGISRKQSVLVEKRLRLTTDKNKTYNSQKQNRTKVQRTTETLNVHQAIKGFPTPTNETENVEEDVFKKSIVPRPPGYRDLEKNEHLSSSATSSNYGGDRMVHKTPLHLKRLHLTKQITVTKAKLKGFGKSVNRKNYTNGKPSVTKSTKKSLGTERLETIQSPKRKVSKKIVNVEAIRVRFEEENQDDDESGGHERLQDSKLTKSAGEKLSDEGSKNEIL